VLWWRSGPEIVTVVLIVLAGLVDAALYGGVVYGEDARAARTEATFDTPAANPPDGGPQFAYQRAELDDNPRLPGRYVPSQGRQHVPGLYPPRDRVEFCPQGQVRDDCYASNPPTSGLHLPVQRNARLEDSGVVINLPPDPGRYEFEIPRESIPHIEEHAGVFLGYNCASAACETAVDAARALVDQELSLGRRVVMAPDSDLPPDTIALASWTRVDSFAAQDYTDERARDFIQAHSCRYDPEGICEQPQVN
jgi:hypothetical protein